ncbi:prolyl oligopeptidase family serine peptidase [Bacillus haynesii]|uniref:prolyl oligopeptidase family serine peptidase n=1 Tax=Bacillus haynesii TaxID=1925021 RepID=UPI001594165D|nr:prolyl oligopeptidase family serine peptidase [Bacillus haynesii]NVB33915.1 prolyl oligopeptidase family serine peptidase [Bacillus licheniformis]MCY7777741.1 prolyl oligopeptidase family serine peptidase [Bacillus haynesii]MCY7816300.1 prolyl oligopeptidase family serine peptidase [Bacillus haynesii]MCY8240674.1 prolyl oligopeptidase family serine peptidase [Bacillus haynesii]MCY8369392.1 prolyl oligopeptidase family serine peptidase [Bacillus haynesii]
MIIIEKQHISNIPLLHIVKEEKKEKALPLVFFIHGFTSAKEHNLHFAYLLAEKGMRVILPEALYHGERDEQLTQEELAPRFWEIVTNEIKELEVLKNHFEQENLIEKGRIGAAGTSMGGIVTLGALTQYEWITTAVSLMGSPAYVEFFDQQLAFMREKKIELPFTEEQVEQQREELKRFDLSLQPDKLNMRPLLFWHGKQDGTVPFALTRRFHESIIPLYVAQPDLLHFIEDERAGHKVSREGLLKTVEWFDAHL